MHMIKLPQKCNYIGVFLTFRCNLGCSYCINRFGEFNMAQEASTERWIEGLSKIPTRIDLPITLQGGEPTMHPGFYEIVTELYRRGKYMDLLTNGMFDVKEFCERVNPLVFERGRVAKYATVRFSYHLKTNPSILLRNVEYMKEKGYSVGIWGLDYPGMKSQNREMEKKCRERGIEWRMKEFLGWYDRRLYGTYKYEGAIEGKRETVMCRTSELLIDPTGEIYRCHRDLYKGIGGIGNILEGRYVSPFLWRVCHNFGECNPCDVKIKYNRFQEWGHCSVEIRRRDRNV